jgi:hypothetical protein
VSSAKPVRLKVAYKSPEALLGELTRSVGRGGVRVESHRALPVGTKFVFELKSPGLKDSVEVPGEVMSVTEKSVGRWVLHIRYEPPSNRLGLDGVIRRIFDTQKADKNRKHARVPLQVRAVEDKPQAPVFRLRDISRGGVGIDVEGDVLPAYIAVGTPFLMQMRLTTGNLAVFGEVVWSVTTKTDALPPRVGVAFGKLKPQTVELLEDLLSLKVLPAPPWIARLEFGQGADSKLP